MEKFKVKIISGGQTGADQIGIITAKAFGLETGGTAPKWWKTENGMAQWLADYGLIESNIPGYPHRTRENVANAMGTVLFGDMGSPGSRETIRYCNVMGKPYLTNPTAVDLAKWIIVYNMTVVNVAGNRGSKLTKEKQDEITKILGDTFVILGYEYIGVTR